MPTFSDHQADATEAHQAVRALAHATRWFDHDDEPVNDHQRRAEHPEDTYWVLGDVLAIVRSLSQVVQQIGAAHTRNIAMAHTDDGDRAEGQRHADAVHRATLEAVFALDHAHEHLNRAMNHSGKIAWCPPTPSATTALKVAPPTESAPRPNPSVPFGTAVVRAVEPGGPRL